MTASASPPTDPPAMTIAAVVSFYLATLLVAVVWSGLTEPGLAQLTAPPKDATIPGWLAGLVTGLSLVLISVLAEPLFPSLRRLSAEIAGVVAPITPLRIAILALSSGIAEEALFRGPVQYSLGYVLASVLFALLHGGLSQRYIAWSTFALVAGLSFGLLAEAYASIWPPVIAHVVVNAINLARLARVDTSEADNSPSG